MHVMGLIASVAGKRPSGIDSMLIKCLCSAEKNPQDPYLVPTWHTIRRMVRVFTLPEGLFKVLKPLEYLLLQKLKKISMWEFIFFRFDARSKTFIEKSYNGSHWWM